jgi:hypothetical protein
LNDGTAGNSVSVAWSSRELLKSNGTTTLNWNAVGWKLDFAVGNSWDDTEFWVTLDDINMTADKGFFIDGKDDSSLTATGGDLFVGTNQQLDLEGGSRVNVTSQGTVYIASTIAGNIDLRLQNGNFLIDENIGWTGTYQVTQSGVTKDVTVYKGIIIGVA